MKLAARVELIKGNGFRLRNPADEKLVTTGRNDTMKAYTDVSLDFGKLLPIAPRLIEVRETDSRIFKARRYRCLEGKHAYSNR